MHLRSPAIRIAPGLRLTIGDTAVVLTPRQGLEMAERLTRASFRQAAEEAVADVPLTMTRVQVAKKAKRV